MNNILNMVLLAGFFISVGYGVWIVTESKETKPIFKVTLISMTAFLISRLFFIVLNISDGDVNGFSVGVLGQVAGYSFLVLANKTYLPFETNRQGFDWRAGLLLLFPLLCYGYSCLVIHTVGELVCSVFYLCSTGLALYFSFKNVLSAKENPDYRGLKAYFVCVLTITVTSTLESMVFFIENSLVFTAAGVVLTVIVFADSVLLLPILNRGLRK